MGYADGEWSILHQFNYHQIRNFIKKKKFGAPSFSFNKWLVLLVILFWYLCFIFFIFHLCFYEKRERLIRIQHEKRKLSLKPITTIKLVKICVKIIHKGSLIVIFLILNIT